MSYLATLSGRQHVCARQMPYAGDLLEHVLHVVGIDQVVDGRDLDVVALKRGAQHEAADAAETWTGRKQQR